MIIGTYTKVDEGYTGSLETITLSVKATITPAEKRNDNAPDFLPVIPLCPHISVGVRVPSNKSCVGGTRDARAI